jgi:hypothetical protein
MRFTGIVLSLVLLCCSVPQAAAHTGGYQDFDTASEELADMQRVIEAAMPDIESLLKTNSSFKPFAVTILANDSIAEIEVKDSTGKGYTEDDLKEELSIGALKGDYKVVAIFYMSQVADPATGKMVKAVAVFAEHHHDDFAYLFYYPYTLSAKKEVIFGDSFGDLAPQVMYKAD